MMELEYMWKRDLLSVAPWTREAEEGAIEQARHGIHEPLITLLLPRVTGWVEHYYLTYRRNDPRIERLDLMGIANLTLVEKVPTALVHPNPGAYLMTAVRGAVLDYCHCSRSLIKLPHTLGVAPIDIESLDMPAFFVDRASDTGETRQARIPLVQSELLPSRRYDMTPLYEAIERLFRPDSQQLLARLFGLFGETETTIEELAEGNYQTARYDTIKVRKSQMVRALRKALKDQYPELVAKPAHRLARAYDRVELTEAQHVHLDRAYQTLRERGERISMRSMIRESRLNNMYVLAYLSQKRQEKEQVNA